MILFEGIRVLFVEGVQDSLYRLGWLACKGRLKV